MKFVKFNQIGLGGLMLSAAIGAVAGDMDSANSIITIKHFAFNPKVITVPAGTEVSWVNRDSFSHSVVLDGTTSRRLMNRSRFKHVFKTAGEYTYQCGVHSSMKGKVIVVESSDSPSVEAQEVSKEPVKPATSSSPAPEPLVGQGTVTIIESDPSGFEPALLTVTPGTVVTWNNNHGSNHIIEFGDQRSQRLRHGASYRRQFDSPGEYAYECAIHGKKMRGKIVVKRK